MLMRVNLIRLCVCVLQESWTFLGHGQWHLEAVTMFVVGFILFVFFLFFNSIWTAEKDCQLADRFTGTLDASTAAGNTTRPAWVPPQPPPAKVYTKRGRRGKFQCIQEEELLLAILYNSFLTRLSKRRRRRWEPAMTRNESPPTRTGVPVHLDTGPSSIAWWGSTWLLLCNEDGTTSPIAENDGERRKKIHHLTTVELATFFLLAFHLEFFKKEKKKKRAPL